MPSCHCLSPLVDFPTLLFWARHQAWQMPGTLCTNSSSAFGASSIELDFVLWKPFGLLVGLFSPISCVSCKDRWAIMFVMRLYIHVYGHNGCALEERLREKKGRILVLYGYGTRHVPCLASKAGYLCIFFFFCLYWSLGAEVSRDSSPVVDLPLVSLRPDLPVV